MASTPPIHQDCVNVDLTSVRCLPSSFSCKGESIWGSIHKLRHAIFDHYGPPPSHIIPYKCMFNVYIVTLADTPPPPLQRDVICECSLGNKCFLLRSVMAYQDSSSRHLCTWKLLCALPDAAPRACFSIDPLLPFPIAQLHQQSSKLR